jgi:hypothetical protein
LRPKRLDPETFLKTPETAVVAQQPTVKKLQKPFIIAPTLREVQRRQKQEEILQIERQYKIKHKESGFMSILGQEPV